MEQRIKQIRNLKTAEEVEKEFDSFFKGIGFKRVSELVGPSPNFSNADYVDADRKIVIELKVLDKNFFEDGGIIDRFQSIIPKPENIDEKGFGQYTFRYPGKNRKGKTDTFEEPLRRIIKKANKQLKEIKEHLFTGNGIGFIIFAMNQFNSLHPFIVCDLICELLKEEFSSVSGFILCTPSFGIYNPETNLNHPICQPMTPYGCPDEVRGVSIEIGQAWVDFGNAGGHK